MKADLYGKVEFTLFQNQSKTLENTYFECMSLNCLSFHIFLSFNYVKRVQMN